MIERNLIEFDYVGSYGYTKNSSSGNYKDIDQMFRKTLHLATKFENCMIEDKENSQVTCSSKIKVVNRLKIRKTWKKLNVFSCSEIDAVDKGYVTINVAPKKLNQSIVPADINSKTIFKLENFIDLSEGREKCVFTKVWNSLKDQGVDQHYIKILQKCYEECSTNITPFSKKVKIPISKGVRQGDPISPNLFSASIEGVFRSTNWSDCGISIDGRKLTTFDSLMMSF
ncbi:unnamed protein product [Caenorhabditis angaria]|uniref:Reverse transcriptase domain-containing protein n=1 Tax=Caenorhabditis angaria TaxID=860376 RepID=A0A9P1IZ85_9PELO|nr:unnamed protein product [Caenorhabditis angaria]